MIPSTHLVRFKKLRIYICKKNFFFAFKMQNNLRWLHCELKLLCRPLKRERPKDDPGSPEEIIAIGRNDKLTFANSLPNTSGRLIFIAKFMYNYLKSDYIFFFFFF